MTNQRKREEDEAEERGHRHSDTSEQEDLEDDDKEFVNQVQQAVQSCHLRRGPQKQQKVLRSQSPI